MRIGGNLTPLIPEPRGRALFLCSHSTDRVRPYCPSVMDLLTADCGVRRNGQVQPGDSGETTTGDKIISEDPTRRLKKSFSS